MKLRKLVRNAVLGTLAYKFVQKRYERRAHARRRASASWASGVIFAAGAGLAYLYREEIAGLVGSLRGQEYVPIADAYDPPPPSHKKQVAAERREAAEKRAREEAAHKPTPKVRVEKNASPDLAVPLADALKH